MLVRALVSAVQDAAGSYVRRISLLVLASLAGMVAIGFLSAALYLYLRYWYGGLLASIWLAALYGVLAMIFTAAAVARKSRTFQRKADQIIAREAEERLAQVRAAVHEVETALRSTGQLAIKSFTPGGLLAVGLAAGFAAARWLRRH